VEEVTAEAAEEVAELEMVVELRNQQVQDHLIQDLAAAEKDLMGKEVNFKVQVAQE
jgi:hypothetical protein